MVKSGEYEIDSKSGGLFGAGENAKKMLVLISMIIIGLLLIIYRGNYKDWSDQFITYNQILFTISLLLFIFILVFLLTDFKNVIKHELTGTIIVLIGAIVLMLVPAGNYIGLGAIASSGIIFFILGGIIISIGAIFLMRTGGYLGVCLLSLLIIMIISAYYMLGDSDAIQYSPNTFLITNYAVIFLILCFILLLYNDLKFFYLAKLIKEERSFRKKKNFDKALSYCNKAIKIYPYFATAWNNKGNVYMNMGKRKDAESCYKKALIINPNYEPAKKNLKMVKI